MFLHSKLNIIVLLTKSQVMIITRDTKGKKITLSGWEHWRKGEKQNSNEENF